MSVTAVFLHAPRKVEVCCQVKDGGSEAKKERLYKLAQLLVLPPVLRLLPQQLQLKALTLWPGLKKVHLHFWNSNSDFQPLCK